MEIARAELEGGRTALRFSGTLDLASVPAVRRAVREIGGARGAGIDLDVSAVDRFEGGGVAGHAWGCSASAGPPAAATALRFSRMRAALPAS